MPKHSMISALFLLVLALPATGQDTASSDHKALTAQIDRVVTARWKQDGIVAAQPASDAEFLRRVYLDIAGKIPPVSRARAFQADERENRRELLVDELLESSRYVANFTTVWRNALIPESIGSPQVRQLVPGFEAWLRKALDEDRPYDEFVRQILTSPLAPNGAPETYVDGSGPTPAAFYLAKEGKAENLAAASSRVFLGRRIGCAQCHDHPMDEWKQEQFWQFAAFFSGIDPRSREQGEKLKPATIRIPDTESVVRASFLDGIEPDLAGTDSRRALAEWVIARNNPFFAEMAVNRLWGHFFGRGIVDPVDDFSPLNPPSHPGLLEKLAQDFIAHDYDLKYIIRAITASQAYQLSSRQTDASQADGAALGRMAVKGLTPEQMFDTLAEATGHFEAYRADQPFVLQDNTPRAEFLELFRNESDSRTEQETTILQALAMMNGEFVALHTHLERSQTLAAVADVPFLDNEQKVETLFLAALSRSPTDSERKRFTEYVERGGTGGDQKTALCDVFWVLLNSSEFLLNH